MPNIRINLSDQIIFSENVYSNEISAQVDDYLEFTETITYQPTNTQYKDALNFSERIQYSFPFKTYTVTDNLIFNESFSRVHIERITDYLSFTEAINPPIPETIFDQLYFFETITYRHNLVNFVQTDYLIFNESIGYNQIQIARSMQSQISCDPIPTNHIQLGNVVLRAPNLGNKDVYNKIRIDAKTRSNELLIGGPDFWPKDRTINFDFDSLTLSAVVELLQFLTKNAGLQISFDDHEGNNYHGIVINPSPEVKQNRNPDCSYSLSLEIMVI